jgi:hypothetical protein
VLLQRRKRILVFKRFFPSKLIFSAVQFLPPKTSFLYRFRYLLLILCSFFCLLALLLSSLPLLYTHYRASLRLGAGGEHRPSREISSPPPPPHTHTPTPTQTSGGREGVDSRCVGGPVGYCEGFSCRGSAQCLCSPFIVNTAVPHFSVSLDSAVSRACASLEPSTPPFFTVHQIQKKKNN